MKKTHAARPKNTTVAVGMSGGVDSAVSVLRLLDQGYNVLGLTMSIWDPALSITASKKSACYGPGEAEDIKSARETAEQLGIPHHTISLVDEYDHWVLNNFRNRHLEGFTPNPCALCNPKMKFGFLLSRARELGLRFDRFATGHYARVTHDPVADSYRLWRGVDATKDQSYFLARLTQEQLAEVIFPLGELTKCEVRERACRAGLGTLAEKRESQDFFEGDDVGVLFDPSATRPGPIVDETGTVMGQHRGIIHYTVGQRDGLGIAVGRKVYVKEIRAETNTLIVANREGVYSSGCRLVDMLWIAGKPPNTDQTLSVRLRYRHAGVAAHVEALSEKGLNVRFASPQFAVTPGQMAVLYHGEEVLGGGWIDKPDEENERLSSL